MPEHDYEQMRRDVERWAEEESDALDRWEEARWKEYDADPEGRSIDTIGDGAGFRFQATENKKDEFLGLILLAEEAEKSGDLDEANELIARLERGLGRSDFSPEPAGDPASGTDPTTHPAETREHPIVNAVHDFTALRNAVDRWSDAEEADLDRWEQEQRTEYDKDPEGRYSDTIDEGAGIRFTSIRSKAEDFRRRIQMAEELERKGQIEEAGRIVGQLRDELPAIDKTAVFTPAAGASRWEKVRVAWILLAVVAVVAALFSFWE